MLASVYLKRTKAGMLESVIYNCGRLVIALLVTAVTAFCSGDVLDPAATPFGVSLTTMLVDMAQINASLNNPLYYPNTPFQILFVPNPSRRQHGKAMSCPNGGSG